MQPYIEETYTTWENPLPVDATVPIDLGNGRIVGFTAKANGGTVQVPSRYDAAIHRIHKGQVIGGLAPQWRKHGAAPLPIADALDTQAEQKRQADVELARAEAARQLATEAVILAGSKVAKAAK